MLKGMAAEVTFYKALFDKIGVKADWMQVGKYKSYGEPFTRTEMSPAFREEVAELLTDTYTMLAEGDRRALQDQRRRRQGPHRRRPLHPGPGQGGRPGRPRSPTPTSLRRTIAAKLGVKSVRRDEKYGKPKERGRLLGIRRLHEDDVRPWPAKDPKKVESTTPKVALIYASGAIMTGKSSGGSLMGESTMGSDTVIKHLKPGRE